VAEPYRNTPGGTDADRAKMMRVLIPAGAIALIIILVAVIMSAFEGNNPTTDKGKGGHHKSAYGPPTGGTDVSKMTDGTDPTADDTGLQPIGPPGLKYRDLKVGDGAVVRPGQEVTAYYTGWFTNGKVFDSSREKGEPISFPLNGVIQGWTEGIPGMKVGGIRKLYIPSDLAYGPKGRDRIPPNSTLIFEVEIVDAK
jgi:hypothetical protein